MPLYGSSPAIPSHKSHFDPPQITKKSPAEILAPLDELREPQRVRVMCLLRRFAHYDIDYAGARTHATALRCSYRTVLRDVAWLAVRGLLVVVARAETSQERTLPDAVRAVLDMVGPDGRAAKMSQRVPKRHPRGMTQTLRTPHAKSVTKSLSLSTIERDDKKTIAAVTSDEQRAINALRVEGIRFQSKARSLVATYGPAIVSEVIATGKHRAARFDRGAYLIACLADRMSESYAAREAEARAIPPPAKKTVPPAQHAARTVIDSPRAQLSAPGSAQRAIEDEQRERHAAEERARVAAASRREAERGEALLALSESERAYLDERARLSLPQHQRAPWDIRRRAVAMLHGEYDATDVARVLRKSVSSLTSVAFAKIKDAPKWSNSSPPCIPSSRT